LKIYDVKKEITNHNYNIGKLITTKSEIKIAVSNGFINIESLQLSGKRKMDSKSLLNGFDFKDNAKVQ